MDEMLEIPGTRREGCSRRSLERLLTGELDTEESARVRRHAESCPRCGSALAELEREAADFKNQVAFESFEAAIEARRHRASMRWLKPVGLALAAGLAALMLAGPLRPAIFESHSGYNNLKGGAALELYVGGTGASSRIATSDEKLAPGERIRVGYQAAGKPFVLVLSIDEAGVVTPLYPESGQSVAADSTSGTHLMPDSLELTGSGLERVIALFSARPIEVSAATQAARDEHARARGVAAMGPLSLEAEQSTLVVRKP
jgi:predicted anti-sigma-YlaC factor YlaD